MKKPPAVKFNSLSTPGVKQDLSNYLVELVFLRDNKGIRLSPKFWQEVKYKFRYRREIQSCRKFIKKYGPARALKIALDNYITTWTDFAKIEVLLQKLKESEERLASLKDTTSVKIDFVPEVKDFREKTPVTKKNKNLFERLSELENGSN